MRLATLSQVDSYFCSGRSVSRLQKVFHAEPGVAPVNVVEPVHHKGLPIIRYLGLGGVPKSTVCDLHAKVFVQGNAGQRAVVPLTM